MNKHEIDLLSLAFGVFFLVAAVAWAVAKMIDVSWFSIGWLFAGGMVLIGLLGVLSAIRPRSSR